MAEHIKTIVDEYIKKNKQKQKQYENIKKILKETLNKNIAEQVKIEIQPKQKVVFFLRSSSAVYGFRLQKNKIEEKVKKELPKIKEIKIEVK
ncbi:MAG: hypothetical protein R6U54_00920 [Candidatus Omnitrophota bacterium]